MTANLLSVALIAAQTALAPAQAADMRTPDGTAVVAAAADCSGAAAQVVSQTGGQLLSAASQNQGGQTVCVITVLVPGNGSERPKKVTVSVPQ
ncbi:hypothetical protein [Hoeflea sp.]|uniref:hypothetical protein n=1 Tax=Hoeflea sp. TaxID=1940281 RepID=UPI003BAE52A1